VAARLIRLAAAIGVVYVLAGCATSPGGAVASVPPAQAAFPTPQRSFSAQIGETVAALRTRLGDAYPLVQLSAAYRPSEPQSMQFVQRAALQVDLGAPDQNYVVVYEFTDPQSAAARAQEMARYLAGGYGQTNYPPDAQFAVSQFGSTVVFAWWSPDRSSNAARARAAFALISGFGQPVPVPK
jgi:hypothetical protein